MKKNLPELLAPAGSMDALKAAVNAGADAVYLSGKQFGARYYAANFDNTDLKEAVRYAHLRGVKIHVTVNTLVKDHEIVDVAEYLLFLYEIGVDAVLVQDTGVASLAKKIVPGLNLHASTQMTIHNLEGVKWASEFGFKRVVLAREMELSEIEEISKQLKLEEIELEIFGHGALCYSYSGQCLLSSFIGGRSGNRGMCAQPCRKTYNLITGEKDEYGRPVNTHKIPIKEKYLLSTRDLSIYEHLERISKSPIDSIKIEGRMRSPEYVAIVVNIYRNALDSIAKGKWKPDKNKINDLRFAFNRGFTGGYLLENEKGMIMGRNLPGNRGVYIGTLIDYKRENKEAVIKIEENIIPQKGDGIVFISSDHSPNKYGTVIHKSPVIKKNKAILEVNKSFKPGTAVYITRRKSLIDKAQKIISGAQDKYAQISADLDISIENDGSIILKSKFIDGNNVLKELKLHSDFKMQKAINKPLSKEIIKNQFKKTGGTPFSIKNMDITYPGNLFAPLGELNKLRRELLGKVEEEILSTYLPGEDKIEKAYSELNKLNEGLIGTKNKKINKTPNLAIYADNLEIVKGAIEGGCDKVYFDPFKNYAYLNCKNKQEINLEKILNLIKEALLISKNSNTKLVLKLPEITPDSFLASIDTLLAQVLKAGIDEFMTDGIGAAKFLLNLNPNINLYASTGLNIWNQESIKGLRHIYKGFTLSPELSRDEIRNTTSINFEEENDIELELLVQGNLESIISKDCMPCISKDIIKEYNLEKFLGIEDAKNRIFPVQLDSECRTHILNSVELCLIDYIPQLSNRSIDTFVIDARGKTKKYAHDMSSIYKNAVKLANEEHGKRKIDLNVMKNKVKKISSGGITTGNFIRGVKEE